MMIINDMSKQVMVLLEYLWSILWYKLWIKSVEPIAHIISSGRYDIR